MREFRTSGSVGGRQVTAASEAISEAVSLASKVFAEHVHEYVLEPVSA